jgi:hypothetical protein
VRFGESLSRITIALAAAYWTFVTVEMNTGNGIICFSVDEQVKNNLAHGLSATAFVVWAIAGNKRVTFIAVGIAVISWLLCPLMVSGIP